MRRTRRKKLTGEEGFFCCWRGQGCQNGVGFLWGGGRVNEPRRSQLEGATARARRRGKG